MTVCVLFSLYCCVAALFHKKTSANRQRCNTANFIVHKKTQPWCTFNKTQRNRNKTAKRHRGDVLIKELCGTESHSYVVS